ncbi:hypothetical protein TSMEX_008900 [Taenia solium]|eukprot:TsM_000303300 transcript=TsM_000303300 gene=TsM_000303300
MHCSGKGEGQCRDGFHLEPKRPSWCRERRSGSLHALRSGKQQRLHLVSRACDRIGADVGGSNVGGSINLDAAVHHFHSLFLYKFGKPWGVKLVNFVRMLCRFYPLGL